MTITIFFKDLFVLLGSQKERGGLPSACWFSKRPELIQSQTGSQELLPGFPCGWRGPRPWALLCCFSKLLARSWIRNRANRSQVSAHVTHWCHRQISLIHHSTGPWFQNLKADFCYTRILSQFTLSGRRLWAEPLGNLLPQSQCGCLCIWWYLRTGTYFLFLLASGKHFATPHHFCALI